ncbi:signal protein [Echinicola strongylocentroti]|uniref:Signal protein n=1 Tax=Echinicola strongylocentroti TaxID=1795355 RepID=A0A2Z4IQM9_9BACT|nr:DUF4421 domain-containing protein [Echinicola strongylocentroti]AWW33124.1 signal protein [Echinicola strongylocentroti]
MICAFPSTELRAQIQNDTSYFERFPEMVTGRMYMSRKYTGVDINDRLGEISTLRYRPNSTLNLGVGASYNVFTLNLALGFGFLNPEVGKGDTKYLDAQVHAYPDKWAIDGFAQIYNGYHLVPEGDFAIENENYYYRPDMKVREFGASVKYVFNGEKFSYKAAFLQTEWQKKSAGSLLVGGEVFGGLAKGDSSLIPSQAMIDPSRDFDKLFFVEAGPNIGYAYTLVIDQHYFVMGSATGNIGVGFTNQYGLEKTTNWSVNANYFLKASVGYNSERWAVNANYVYSKVRLAKNNDFNNSILTGNYRLNLIYRFIPGPKGKKVLDAINPYHYLK